MKNSTFRYESSVDARMGDYALVDMSDRGQADGGPAVNL
jgi:hypothetical protein